MSKVITRRVSKLTLAAVPTAVSCARLFVRHILEEWQLADLVDMAELLTSELVTNAVKTTGTVDSPLDSMLGEVHVIQVRLVVVAGSLFIGVWDPDERPPVLQQPALDAEGGRGLFLIDCIARQWGHHHPGVGGKVVWCELGIDHACHCEWPADSYPDTIPDHRLSPQRPG